MLGVERGILTQLIFVPWATVATDSLPHVSSLLVHEVNSKLQPMEDVFCEQSLPVGVLGLYVTEDDCIVI